MNEEPKKFFGFYHKSIAIACYSMILGFSLLVLFTMTYNVETGIWFDTPLLDPDYFVFHPHSSDSCEILQEKLLLFHPEGTNPIKFEILESMIKKRCQIEWMFN